MATLITADVFILGFLLTGVMADYKESEKLPGDLAVSIGAIADECFVLWHHQQAQPAVECLHHLMDLTTSLKAWFYRREQTEALLEQVSDLGDFFAAIEPFSQANFIVRLKQEQNSISRMLVRIHTIRETSFVSSAYTMARLATFLILGGLLTLKVESWSIRISHRGYRFVLTYLMLLIRIWTTRSTTGRMERQRARSFAQAD